MNNQYPFYGIIDRGRRYQSTKCQNAPIIICQMSLLKFYSESIFHYLKSEQEIPIKTIGTVTRTQLIDKNMFSFILSDTLDTIECTYFLDYDEQALQILPNIKVGDFVILIGFYTTKNLETDQPLHKIRVDRFVVIDDLDQECWQGNYFYGLPRLEIKHQQIKQMKGADNIIQVIQNKINIPDMLKMRGLLLQTIIMLLDNNPDLTIISINSALVCKQKLLRNYIENKKIDPVAFETLMKDTIKYFSCYKLLEKIESCEKYRFHKANLRFLEKSIISYIEECGSNGGNLSILVFMLNNRYYGVEDTNDFIIQQYGMNIILSRLKQQQKIYVIDNKIYLM